MGIFSMWNNHRARQSGKYAKAMARQPAYRPVAPMAPAPPPAQVQQTAWQAGYAAGLRQGHQEGRREGWNAGWEAGQAAIADGLRTGRITPEQLTPPRP